MMYGPPNMGSCDCSFRSSALDYIIASINQLTFLTATGMIDSKPFQGLPQGKNAFPSALPEATLIAVDSNTTTTFRQSGSESVQLTDVVHYKTHWVYAGLAFGITTLCIILVIPSFWHYGELGRRVTLGPVEIASAFGAPILVDNNRGAGSGPKKDNIDTLIEHIGDRKIVYGFVDVNAPEEQKPQQMSIQPPGSTPTSPRPEGGDGLAIVTNDSSVPNSPMMSPGLEQGEGITSKMQKRRSVRLAMGPPERVRPTSQVVPLPMSPRLGGLKE